jgi:hypothetical protein
MLQAISEANVAASRVMAGDLLVNPQSVMQELSNKLIEQFEGWTYSSCEGFFVRRPKNPEAVYRRFPEMRLDLSRFLEAVQVQVESKWYVFETAISPIEDQWQISLPEYCKYLTRRVKDEEAITNCEDCGYLITSEGRSCYLHPESPFKAFQAGKEYKTLLEEEDWSTTILMTMRGMTI